MQGCVGDENNYNNSLPPLAPSPPTPLIAFAHHQCFSAALPAPSYMASAMAETTMPGPFAASRDWYVMRTAITTTSVLSPEHDTVNDGT